MASWQNDDDDDDEVRQGRYCQQTTWRQLQRQRTELHKPNNSTSKPHQSHTRQRAFNNLAPALTYEEWEDTDQIKPLSRQQCYYSLTNDGYSNQRKDLSSLIYDVDSSSSKNDGFHASRRSTLPAINYVDLNRRQLKGQNNKKLYPEKTYTEMFNKKKHFYDGYTNRNHKEGKC